jgi:hypothetical protein
VSSDISQKEWISKCLFLFLISDGQNGPVFIKTLSMSQKRESDSEYSFADLLKALRKRGMGSQLHWDGRYFAVETPRDSRGILTTDTDVPKVSTKALCRVRTRPTIKSSLGRPGESTGGWRLAHSFPRSWCTWNLEHIPPGAGNHPTFRRTLEASPRSPQVARGTLAASPDHDAPAAWSIPPQR